MELPPFLASSSSSVSIVTNGNNGHYVPAHVSYSFQSVPENVWPSSNCFASMTPSYTSSSPSSLSASVIPCVEGRKIDSSINGEYLTPVTFHILTPQQNPHHQVSYAPNPYGLSAIDIENDANHPIQTEHYLLTTGGMEELRALPPTTLVVGCGIDAAGPSQNNVNIVVNGVRSMIWMTIVHCKYVFRKTYRNLKDI